MLVAKYQMQARLLTADDLPYYEKLLERSYFGKEKERENTKQNYINGLLISKETSRFRVYGTFDNDELLSACATHLWENQKAYTMIYVMIHPKFSSMRFDRSFEESGLRLSIHEAVSYAEQQEYWQFYYATHLKNYKTRKNAWFQKSDILVGRYDWSIDGIIPAGTLPSTPLHSKIIYHQSRGVDLVVKTARLKPELIFNYYHKKGLMPFSYKEVYPDETV